MPFWDFRFHLDSIDNSFQFSRGTADYPESWIDVVSLVFLPFHRQSFFLEVIGLSHSLGVNFL